MGLISCFLIMTLLKPNYKAPREEKEEASIRETEVCACVCDCIRKKAENGRRCNYAKVWLALG